MPPRPLPFDPIEEARRQWQARWAPDAATEMVAVTSIMRVHQILMARLNELLEPFDLTFPRYEVLMLLHFSSRGSLPVGKIGERLQVHRTSITNSIDGLERGGLVRRTPHESDGRATLAAILPAGREVAERATRVLNEADFGTAPLEEPTSRSSRPSSKNSASEPRTSHPRTRKARSRQG